MLHPIRVVVLFSGGCCGWGAVGGEQGVFISKGGVGVGACMEKGFRVLPVPSREWRGVK